MKQNKVAEGIKPALRSRAEAAVLKNRAGVGKGLPPLPHEEAQKIIHELQVHQVELEMQNEELSRVRADLEVARRHYFDLYHLAPVGYCILSREGLVLEANLTAVNMLDLALSTLVKKPITRFIFKDDEDIYYLHRKQLYLGNRSASCELRMVKKDGTPFWVQLTSAPPDALDGVGSEPVCRVVLSDITERRKVQEENAKLLAQLHPPKRAPKKAAGKP
jgi:PAS domain S-box-containing protein